MNFFRQNKLLKKFASIIISKELHEESNFDNLTQISAALEKLNSTNFDFLQPISHLGLPLPIVYIIIILIQVFLIILTCLMVMWVVDRCRHHGSFRCDTTNSSSNQTRSVISSPSPLGLSNVEYNKSEIVYLESPSINKKNNQV